MLWVKLGLIKIHLGPQMLFLIFTFSQYTPGAPAIRHTKGLIELCVMSSKAQKALKLITDYTGHG